MLSCVPQPVCPCFMRAQTIGALTRLKRLELSANNLYELPRSFAKLRALKELWLAGNALTTFPHQVVHMHMHMLACTCSHAHARMLAGRACDAARGRWQLTRRRPPPLL